MTGPDTRSRQQAQKAGRRTEWLAGMFLRMKGYRLLARNVQTPMGEVDLVMRRGKTVIFVEVKRRAGAVPPGLAVTRRQQERIARAATFLAASGRYGTDVESYRIDLILMAAGRMPSHVRDAWRA
ncbi:YraN family protein [Minwuia sp.]|uniref:YraN family protein n=1 Tax=Minwuia sp. TaxID=2493630 RepID=UPI003A8E6000